MTEIENQTENDKAMKNTYAGRTLRIKNLIEYIKKHSPVTLADIYRHMMLEYFLSAETVDKYVRDLENTKIINVHSETNYSAVDPEKVQISFIGEGSD